MTDKEVWELYYRLKRHFKSTSYDFFLNQKKVPPLKPESSDSRACASLSTLPKVELFGRILSNLLVNPGIIPIQLLDNKAKEVWEFWDFRIQNKYWLFYKQLSTHFDKYKSFDLESLVHGYCSSLISPETLVGLYRSGYEFSLSHSDPIVSTVSRLILKYDSFLTFDTTQTHAILKKLQSGDTP